MSVRVCINSHSCRSSPDMYHFLSVVKYKRKMFKLLFSRNQKWIMIYTAIAFCEEQNKTEKVLYLTGELMREQFAPSLHAGFRSESQRSREDMNTQDWLFLSNSTTERSRAQVWTFQCMLKIITAICMKNRDSVPLIDWSASLMRVLVLCYCMVIKHNQRISNTIMPIWHLCTWTQASSNTENK